MFRLIFLSCLLLPHLTLAFHPNVVVPRWRTDRTDRGGGGGQLLPPRHPEQQRRTLVYSTTTTSTTTSNDGTSSSPDGKFDGTAVVKYGVAIAVQMTLVTLLFRSMDALVSYSKLQKVPFVVNFLLFYGLALKSRLLNPMSNTRPKVSTLEAASVHDATTTTSNNNNNQQPVGGDVATMFKRKMPSWTPPGIVFPIVWLLIIGPIRAATTSMIYASVGSYASIPILSLALHLSIGDVWNTINNVERRFGVAVTGVGCVWLSKAHAAYQYRLVNPNAGALLGATLIWLTIASALVTATWRLNPDPVTGKPEPLYPVVGKATTKFAWLAQKS